MSYHLTLELSERRAIDWIGHRYAHGDELRDALTDESVCQFVCQAPGDELTEDEQDDTWNAPYPITFAMPEHIAWMIRESIMSGHRDDDGSPSIECFASTLRRKLISLCDSIV
jgi:hypothetical protein